MALIQQRFKMTNSGTCAVVRGGGYNCKSRSRSKGKWIQSHHQLNIDSFYNIEAKNRSSSNLSNEELVTQ